jgi:hypothetical protein
MQTISQLTETLLNGTHASRKQEQPLSAPQKSASPAGNPPPSKSSPKTEQPHELEQFTLALSQACVLLKQYGKAPAELRTLRDGYLAFLPDIPIAKLTEALRVHVTQNDEIPTPRQLKEIISPTPKPWKPDWPVYIALKEKIADGYFPYQDERDYLYRCERHAIGGALHDGSMEDDVGQKAARIVQKQRAIAYEESQEMATVEQFTKLREELSAMCIQPEADRKEYPIPDRAYFEARRLMPQEDQPQEDKEPV